MSKSDLGSWTPITSPKTAELFPNQFIRKKNIDFTPTTVNSNKLTDPPTRFTNVKGGGIGIFMTRPKCQNMLRWSGQNANQKVGMDKMPTTEISPDKMPTFGWHYVRLAFCPVGILSTHLSGKGRIQTFSSNLDY